jgi:hypothetical protein
MEATTGQVRSRMKKEVLPISQITRNVFEKPYNHDIAMELCKAIATTELGTKIICKEMRKENKDWPAYQTVYIWLRDNEEFRKQYELAKRWQVQVIVDEIIDIADDNTRDFVYNEKGEIMADKDHINRARLRIDSRKWVAAKLVPKLYGDKLQLDTPNEGDKEDLDKIRNILHKCSTSTGS